MAYSRNDAAVADSGGGDNLSVMAQTSRRHGCSRARWTTSTRPATTTSACSASRSATAARRATEQMGPGDLIVYYVTVVKAFARDRPHHRRDVRTGQIWPASPATRTQYPWRFETEPVLVLPEEDFVPAERARRRARAHRQVAGRALDARLPGPAADDLGRRPRGHRGPHARRGRRRRDRVSKRVTIRPDA